MTPQRHWLRWNWRATQLAHLGHRRPSIVELERRNISVSAGDKAPARGTDRKVVIAAESSPFADSLIDLAQLRGWQVEFIEDGKEVLDTVKKVSPEAVVLDDSIVGARIGDLSRTLKTRRKTSDINVITLTPFGSPERARRNASFAERRRALPAFR